MSGPLLFATVKIPGGSLFGNVGFVECGGVTCVRMPLAAAREELASCPAVVVSFGVGRVSVPPGIADAELAELLGTAPRHARLIREPSAGDFMVVEWLFPVGAVVRVRDEEVSSLVVRPTDREPDGGPGMWECCVAAVLVRTPADDVDGVRRWVQISDLTCVDPAEIGAGVGHG